LAGGKQEEIVKQKRIDRTPMTRLRINPDIFVHY
jgi:hypothetical protein